MKKLLLAAALACGLVSAQAAMNPLFAPLYTADPAVLVDAGRVYLFTGRDEAQPGGKDFVMHEWRVFSTCDMATWKDEGVPIKARDFAWAKGRAWASDITKRNGKYYFYGTVEHATVPGFAIGVAVSDSPTGPFVDARGTALITNDMTKQTDIAWDDIDPAIFIDDDGQAYLYWGNTVLKYAKLKPNMTELDGPIMDVPVANFVEASYLHKHKGTYYLSYSQHFPEETAYMTGPSPTGPWTPQGVVMERNTKTPTIHQAFFDFNGKSYVAYHNAELPGGGEYRRSVAVEEFAYRADGTIPFIHQTQSGPKPNPSAGCKP
ncbi:glycoside hydrolase family 43 protein [Roseateles sp. BYS78W]|uniref:Glycoside hydrolase family 43 protein n=1 Tax=Pelomonas candidula TaxID=3299025 RepID=A0ABW7H877_9BURK